MRNRFVAACPPPSASSPPFLLLNLILISMSTGSSNVLTSSSLRSVLDHFAIKIGHVQSGLAAFH